MSSKLNFTKRQYFQRYNFFWMEFAQKRNCEQKAFSRNSNILKSIWKEITKEILSYVHRQYAIAAFKCPWGFFFAFFGPHLCKLLDGYRGLKEFSVSAINSTSFQVKHKHFCGWWGNFSCCSPLFFECIPFVNLL